MDLKTDPERSAIMRSVKQKDTGPEMIVRKLLYSLGLRYRLHRRNLPGSPDVVFVSKKVAVFIHGCFWHRHADCKRVTTPKANADFWRGKFERNMERDRDNEANLKAMGWRVLVIWECETRDLKKLTRRIVEFFRLG
ncbi:MAG TPA: very short patch repair endonuclease [Terracidiphilus sp.]